MNIRFRHYLLVLFLLAPYRAHASILLTYREPITAKAVAVFDASSKTIMLEKNINEPWPLASLTKLMTASVFLDTKPNFNKKITIKAADRSIGSRLGLKTGSIVRIRDLFTAMLSLSANDAAKALSRASGLSHRRFIEKMNEKARLWGLINTAFVEETGLDPGNTSTIQDFTILTEKAFNKKLIAQATIIKKYAFRDLKSGKRYTIRNKNKLLDAPSNITGTKTGFIDESGPNLVAQSEKDGRKIIVIVFGTQLGGHQFKEVRGLLDAAWKEPSPALNERPKISTQQKQKAQTKIRQSQRQSISKGSPETP